MMLRFFCKNVEAASRFRCRECGTQSFFYGLFLIAASEPFRVLFPLAQFQPTSYPRDVERFGGAPRPLAKMRRESSDWGKLRKHMCLHLFVPNLISRLIQHYPPHLSRHLRLRHRMILSTSLEFQSSFHFHQIHD